MLTLEATKKARQMQVFNLPHDTTNTIMLVAVENPRTGERGVGRKAMKTPASIRLLAGGKLEGLDDRVMQAPDVQNAIAAGLVKATNTGGPPAKSKKKGASE